MNECSKEKKSREVLLSICIPTYNRGKIVEECVKNWLKIPLQDIEVVVSDNGSIDDTQNRMEAINDDRLIYHRNSFNIGGMSNVVQTFCHANGKWLLLTSDEDDPQCSNWEIVRKKLLDTNKIAVFHTNVEQFVSLEDARYTRDSFEAYKFIFDTCWYFSGGIYNREILSKCFLEIKRDNLAWSSYAQKTIGIYCSKYGDVASIKELELVHNRNAEFNPTLCTTNFFKAGEAYYMPEARLQQNMCWMDIMSALASNDRVKSHIIDFFISAQLAQMVDYCENLHIVKPLDHKTEYKQCVIKYQQMNVAEWRLLFFCHYKAMIKHARKVRLSCGELKYTYNKKDARALYEKLKKLLFSFAYQLEISKIEILNIFSKYNNIYLWGNGKRSEAVQQFCQKYNIHLNGVCDITNESIGELTLSGIKIVSTDEVKNAKGLILASNQIIYDALKTMDILANIVNMQLYMNI